MFFFLDLCAENYPLIVSYKTPSFLFWYSKLLRTKEIKSLLTLGEIVKFFLFNTLFIFSLIILFYFFILFFFFLYFSQITTLIHSGTKCYKLFFSESLTISMQGTRNVKVGS